MQISERARRDARRSDVHPNTGDRIQHPGRYDRDDAGRELDVNDFTVRPAFTVVLPYRTAMKWMPPIMDNDMPDMGTMTP